MFSDNLRRLRDKALAAIRAPTEPAHRTATGTIVDYATNGAGQVETWTVRPDGATGDVPLIVSPSGRAGEGVGATVILDGTGGATGTLWEIKKVTRQGVGTGGTFPGIPLATPDLDSIRTSIQILQGGAILVYAWFTTYLIAAQWQHSQMIGYEVEVRNNAGAIVGTNSIPPFGSVWSRLDDALSAGVTTFDLQSGYGNPSLIRGSWGILGIEDELILFERFTLSSLEFTGAERGYDSTDDEGHADQQLVRLRGMGIPVGGLEPNKNYEGRVRAVSQDGRESTWTAWTAFTTAYDTTPPTWSGSVGLTVEAIREGFAVGWNPANTNATDLAYYEVRVSPDNSTWVTYRAGNGTGYVHQAKAGSVLYFAVRAVDTTGNASSWSSSVRSFTEKEEGPLAALAEDLITNGTFASNVTGWALDGISSATLAHDSTHGARALGCALIEEAGAPFPTSPQLYQDGIAVDEGFEYVVQVYVARNADVLVTDTLRLRLGFTGTSAVYFSAIVAGNQLPLITDNKWLMFEAVGVAPKGATEARVALDMVLTRDDPDVSQIYVDDVRMFARPATKGTAVEAGADFDRFAAGGTGWITGIKIHEEDWDPDPLYAGEYTTTVVTVSGAATGDGVLAGLTSINDPNMKLTGTVVDAGSVLVVLQNTDQSGLALPAVDLDEGTLRLFIFKGEA